MQRCSLLVYARQATTRVATTQPNKVEATPVHMESCEAPPNKCPLPYIPPSNKAPANRTPRLEGLNTYSPYHRSTILFVEQSS